MEGTVSADAFIWGENDLREVRPDPQLACGTLCSLPDGHLVGLPGGPLAETQEAQTQEAESQEAQPCPLLQDHLLCPSGHRWGPLAVRRELRSNEI